MPPRTARPSRPFTKRDLDKALRQPFGVTKSGKPKPIKVHVWDVPGLYLVRDLPGKNHPEGLLHWMWRYSRLNGEGVTETGIGHFQFVTLEDAKRIALEYHFQLKYKQNDPQTRKQIGAAQRMTFADVVDEFLKTKTNWTPRHHREANLFLRDHAAKLQKLGIAHINRLTIEEAIAPLFEKSYNQAKRVLYLWAQVLVLAKYKNWYPFENPALWKGMHVTRFKRKLETKHHPTIPYLEIADFMQVLRKHDSIPARALEFCILTVTRTSETLGMELAEVEWEQKIWTIPAERMKKGREHQVPLSDRALEILKEQATVAQFVFGGLKPLGEGALLDFLRTLEDKATVHGFRSTFRDWAGDCTEFAREHIEACLAHRVGNGTENAYRRMSALMKRRDIMQAWTDFCVASTVLACR
jgi:integrase